MTTTMDETIRSSPDLESAIARAVEILKSVIGQSREPVTAEWKLATDQRKRPMIELTLSDSAGSVEARFSPDELRKPDQLRGRLDWLWGDLLQIRSHKQLQKLKQMVQDLKD